MSKLTQRELEVIVMTMQSFETQPKVNYEKLAQLGKFKNVASARACSLAARKKLMGGATTADAALGSPATKAPSTAAGTKRKSAPTPGPTTTKRARKNATRSASPSPLPAEDEDELMETKPDANEVKKEEDVVDGNGEGEKSLEGGAVRDVSEESEA